MRSFVLLLCILSFTAVGCTTMNAKDKELMQKAVQAGEDVKASVSAAEASAAKASSEADRAKAEADRASREADRAAISADKAAGAATVAEDAAAKAVKAFEMKQRK